MGAVIRGRLPIDTDHEPDVTGIRDRVEAHVGGEEIPPCKRRSEDAGARVEVSGVEVPRGGGAPGLHSCVGPPRKAHGRVHVSGETDHRTAQGVHRKAGLALHIVVPVSVRVDEQRECLASSQVDVACHRGGDVGGVRVALDGVQPRVGVRGVVDGHHEARVATAQHVQAHVAGDMVVAGARRMKVARCLVEGVALVHEPRRARGAPGGYNSKLAARPSSVAVHEVNGKAALSLDSVSGVRGREHCQGDPVTCVHLDVAVQVHGEIGVDGIRLDRVQAVANVGGAVDQDKQPEVARARSVQANVGRHVVEATGAGDKGGAVEIGMVRVHGRAGGRPRSDLRRARGGDVLVAGLVGHKGFRRLQQMP
mmetsp:Transcript_33536/g.80483  ORF Transcript_33536/g.80483 Transcript_33536/m.80483 type:complete len:366 (+) Transcript_33536:2945-4042(+)